MGSCLNSCLYQLLSDSRLYPGEFHGLYSPCGPKELDMIEQLSLYDYIVKVTNKFKQWQVDKWCQEVFYFHSFTYNCPVSPASLIEEAVFLPLYILASFVKDMVPIGIWVYLQAFYLVSLANISVFVPVQYCVNISLSYICHICLKSGRSFFLGQDSFGLLCLHINCKTFCFNFVKTAIGRLIGIALNLQIALSSIVIFTVLSLPVQEHGVALHLFVSSLISFISVLKFCTYRSFVFLGRFIPRYFILFVAVVNGIVSLVSVSDFSLLVYRNARISVY